MVLLFDRGLPYLRQKEGVSNFKQKETGKMTTLRSQRVAVLVDGQNLYLSSKQFGGKPDYSKIMKKLEGRNIVRAIIYNIQPEGVDQSKFIYAMNALGYEVKSKRPRRLADGTLKSDWDMQIAIDALTLADKVDAMVILTGDSDFVPLVHALRSKGVKVEIMSFRESTGNELIEAADVYIEITEDMIIHDREY